MGDLCDLGLEIFPMAWVSDQGNGMSLWISCLDEGQGGNRQRHNGSSELHKCEE